MSKILANYSLHRQAFNSMLSSKCSKRILFFKGKSGTGKTSLLGTCVSKLRDEKERFITFDLGKEHVGIDEIFQRSLSNLGDEMFPQLIDELHTLSMNVNIGNVEQRGTGNLIHVALTTGDKEQITQRYTSLTNAWIADIKNSSTTVFLFFDNFEDSKRELKDWFSSVFLSRVANCQLLHIIVSGSEVPDKNNIDWGHICELHKLEGVHNPEHWLELVKEKKLVLPGDNHNSQLWWLKGICDAFQGQPNQIMQVLETL